VQLLTNLHKHQILAVEKLKKITIAALYLEQGVGKTRTALELINIRLEQKKVDKVIWLCPCSVKSEIKREFEKHIQGQHNILVYGIESMSTSIKLNSLLYSICKNNKVYLIIDESNLVKNHKAKRTENIQRLADLCKYKLILNGTPISKNEADLFSQWHLLDWRILGYKSYWSFAANHLEYDEYGKIRRCLNTDYLSRKIAPYTYQVKKSECFDLEDKLCEQYGFTMTRKQEEHYIEVKNEFLMQVDEWHPSTLYRLFTALQHVSSGNKIISKYKKPIKTIPFFNNVYDNPRIQKLLEFTKEVKTIIWCKYTNEIKDIEKVLIDKYGKDKVVTFYGEIKPNQRIKNIEKFRNEATFFIANKTCAGYGLNLQFCCRAIYYSNDWDYATRIQSEDRIYRFGQDKTVKIIDIAAYATLDWQIINCLNRKESLVIHSNPQ